MMGTGSFAEPTFTALLGSAHQVVGLVTQPDRQTGKERGSTRQARRGSPPLACHGRWLARGQVMETTVLGYPRIGGRRDLKKATESWWAGRIDAVQLDGSTCHCAAAAWISIARVAAPATRSGFQNARTELEFPVAWNPKSGLV